MRRKRVLMRARHDSKEPFAFGWIAKLCACLCFQAVLKRRNAQEDDGMAMAKSLRFPLLTESKANFLYRGFAFASNSVTRHGGGRAWASRLTEKRSRTESVGFRRQSWRGRRSRLSRRAAAMLGHCYRVNGLRSA